MPATFFVRYRDLHGREVVSPPEKSLSAAICTGHFLELQRCAIHAITGPGGDIEWEEVRALAATELIPPIAAGGE